MHLPVKVISKSSIVIQPAQVSTADITDLQFLMPAGAGGVGEGFEVAFFFFFGGFGDADFVVFAYGEGDRGGFAQDGDFEEAGVDGGCEV